MDKKKALIAMSGGVDSSVASYLMSSRGYDCVGVTMKLYQSEDIVIDEENSCCSSQDVEDARAVAAKVGIPFEVVNFSDNFKECVMQYFVDTYWNGGTPNPCVQCNRHLKFEKLMERMRELGCDYVVTGHYARIEKNEESGRYLLKKAVDAGKDQSYVLYNLTQDQLAHTLFPLGEYSKAEIRDMAEGQGLVNAQKKDSQDICFVPDGDYASFIERFSGRKAEPGNFVLRDGTVMGQHKGIIRYTIGQRRGLGLSLKAPLYVCEKNVERNEVVLAPSEALFTTTLEADDLNLIAVDHIEGALRCKARVRYNQKEAWASVTQIGDKKIRVEFDEPVRGIAKGQAVVLYHEDIVIGGARIL